MFDLPDISQVIASALSEDLGVEPERFDAAAVPGVDILERDVTSASVVGYDAHFSGAITAREECVVCGLPVIANVFETLSAAAGLFEPVEVFPLVPEGSRVAAGTAVAEVEGLAIAVLAGERTALDFLMILSGIATQTARWVEAAGGEIAVCDTRKTVPGLRELSKYAVRVGGGTNHRAGLWDMVLVKDNHLVRSAGIAQAIRAARLSNPDLVIEVEADTLEQAIEATREGADIVLLDNMDPALMAEAVGMARGRALTEASGNVSLDTLAAIALTGVDLISVGKLTHSARAVDLSLEVTRK